MKLITKKPIIDYGTGYGWPVIGQNDKEKEMVLTCGECGEIVDILIEVGEESTGWPDTETAYLCKSCVEKAYTLIKD